MDQTFSLYNVSHRNSQRVALGWYGLRLSASDKNGSLVANTGVWNYDGYTEKQ